MNRYEIKCTEEQTKKALKLGAPITETGFYDEQKWIHINYTIPTTEQMIGWLEEMNIKCFIIPDLYMDDSYNIQINDKLVTTGHSQYNYPLTYDTRNEAILAVIDAALEKLSTNDLIK